MISPSADVYLNLAAEDRLFKELDGEPTLFLWQNHDAIVIGKWQNAWKECDVAIAERDGIKIARRLTGGGAVFHDLGNLNYTFIACEKDYDAERQTEVIRKALRSLGVNAVVSGRNDLTVNGLKVSGNAFRRSDGKGLHHGTLLISVDGCKMGKYLRPSPLKLSAKGVGSVRSRVCSLKEVVSDISVSDVAKSIAESFTAEYGAAKFLKFVPENYVKEAQAFASEEFVFGKNPPYALRVEFASSCGLTEIGFEVVKGTVAAAKIYSDTLDEELPLKAEKALTGIPFAPDSIRNTLNTYGDRSLGEFGDSLFEALSAQIFGKKK